MRQSHLKGEHPYCAHACCTPCKSDRPVCLEMCGSLCGPDPEQKPPGVLVPEPGRNDVPVDGGGVVRDGWKSCKQFQTNRNVIEAFGSGQRWLIIPLGVVGYLIG